MVGRTSKTREATQTVGLHGQHQAVDKITISQCVRAAEDRSRWKEIVRQVMLANNQTRSVETKKTRHTPSFTHYFTFWQCFSICHDKHVPCRAVQPTTNSRCRKKYVMLGGPLGRARATSAPWLIRHRTHTRVGPIYL